MRLFLLILNRALQGASALLPLRHWGHDTKRPGQFLLFALHSCAVQSTDDAPSTTSSLLLTFYSTEHAIQNSADGVPRLDQLRRLVTGADMQH